MRKTSYVMTALILCLVVIVGIVGITAAWFGDKNSASDVLIVTSAQPSGSATMVLDSGYDGLFPSSIKLRPATLKAGLGIVDRTGVNAYDTLNVPYVYYTSTIENEEPVYTPHHVDVNSLLDTIGDDGDKPFSEEAVAVSTSFAIKFAGSGDRRRLSVEMTSATLKNPRGENNDNGTPDNPGDDYIIVDKTLKDYKTEFISVFTITPVTPSKPVGADVENTPHSTEFTVYSRYEYVVTVTLYFKYADEFTSVDLIDTQIFFNFQLNTLEAITE